MAKTTAPMKVYVISPEIHPYAKTGGLADVAGALGKALNTHGVDVSLIMPKYREVDARKYGLEPVKLPCQCKVGNDRVSCTFYKAPHENSGATVYFVANDGFFDRDGLYGENGQDYTDNLRRFTCFAQASLELIKGLGAKADLIHCNDWQSGLIPAYLRTTLADDPFFKETGTLVTVHNLAFQGLFPYEQFWQTQLPDSSWSMDGVEFWGKIGFLKAGLNYADALNTVSRQYAKEIQTEEFGCGLDGLLRSRAEDLTGILNGADYEEWNPETDPYIAKNFSVTNRAGKVACRKQVLEAFDLPYKTFDGPLFGMVSRLTDQKGFDLLKDTMEDILALGAKFVLLGTGEPRFEEYFKELAVRFPKQAGVRIGFDNALAHQIEAGCDMFLMPSRFEPCGLNQMYSLKYGTIPIVRATGGLDDTITSFNPKTKKGNGFKFKNYSMKDFLGTVMEAVKVFEDQKAWDALMTSALEADFSWEKSAKAYLALYKKILKKKRG